MARSCGNCWLWHRSHLQDSVWDKGGGGCALLRTYRRGAGPFPSSMSRKSTAAAALPRRAQERTDGGDHGVPAELCAREGSRLLWVQLQWTHAELLPETVTYTTKVFSSAPYWQTGETEVTQCKQIWWKPEEIIHVNRIIPAREEERSPISLSYLTLQSTIQQYYLLYDKRAFYSSMMWSSFAWKISSVFSKILLVSQRENGDYTSKP